MNSSASHPSKLMVIQMLILSGRVFHNMVNKIHRKTKYRLKFVNTNEQTIAPPISYFYGGIELLVSYMCRSLFPSLKHNFWN